MTISNQTNRTSAVGTGAVGQEIDFSFPISASSDLTVIKRVAATGVESTLSETTNYTVADPNGLEDPTADWSSGGTVTTVIAVETTEEIHIIRDTPMTQSLDLEAGGSFNAENIEAALDKNTKLIIESNDAIQRSLRAPATDSTSLDLEIPSSVDRASKNLGFDAGGNVTVTDDSGTFTTANAFWDDLKVKSPWVDVRAYGATGDGSTDDTAAIQAAIDALPDGTGTGSDPTNQPGGIVYFPTGHYKITAALECKEGIYLAGNGMLATEIYNANTSGDNAIEFANSGRADSEHFGGITNMKIAGNSASGYGLYVNDIGYLRFDNVFVYTHGSDGIRIHQSVDSTWTHCYSLSNGGWGLQITSNAPAYSTVHTFINCRFRCNTSGGVYFNNCVACELRGRCVIESNTGEGLKVDANYNLFNGCYFENNDGGAAGSDHILVAGGYGNIFRDIYYTTGRIHLSGGSHNQFHNLQTPNTDPNFVADSGSSTTYINWTNPVHGLNISGSGTYKITDLAYRTVGTMLTVSGEIELLGSELYNNTSTGNIRISGGGKGAGGQVNCYGPSHATYPSAIYLNGGVLLGQKTFGDADATPSVKGGTSFETGCSGATNITDFDDGKQGQIITIIGKDGGNSTIKHDAAKINLAGGADCTLADCDMLVLYYDGTDWCEISRSDNTP